MKNRYVQFLTIILILVLCTSFAKAQKFVIELKDRKEKFELDGKLDEEIYQRISPVHTVQYGAFDRDSLMNSNAFYLFVKNNKLYIGGQIEIPYLYSTFSTESKIFNSNQTVEIVLQDIRNQDYSYAFIVNSLGSTEQKIYYGRRKLTGVGEQLEDNNAWKVPWNAEVSHQDSIWYLEAGIPLGFEAIADIKPANLGVSIVLREPLDYEISRWPYISDEKSSDEYFSTYSNRQVHYVNPNGSIIQYNGEVYALGESKNYSTSPSTFLEGLNGRIGGEIQVSGNNKSHLRLAAFPDFSEVEDLPIYNNITTLRNYRKDRSGFTLWSEPFFHYGWNGNNHLLYLTDRILSAPPIVQGMYTYNGKQWQIGTKNLWDSLGVLQMNRFKYHSKKLNSTIGLININSIADQSFSLIGVDYLYRKSDLYFIDAKWSISMDGNVNNSNILDQSRYHFSFFNQKKLGFQYYLGLDHVGSAFNSQLSFEDLTDYNAFSTNLGYGWKADEVSRVYRQNVTLRNEVFIQNYTRLIDLLQSQIGYTLEFRSGSKLGLQYTYLIDRLFETFSFREEVYAFKGVYEQNRIKIYIKNSSLNKLHYGLSGEFGEFFDGEFLQLEQNLLWRLSRRMNLELDYIYLMNVVAGYPTLPLVHTHLLRCKWTYQMNQKLALKVQLQSLNARTLSTSFVNLHWTPSKKWHLNLIYRGKNQLQKLLARTNPNTMIDEQRLVLKLKYVI